MARPFPKHADHPMYIYLILLLCKVIYVRYILTGEWNLLAGLWSELPIFLLLFGCMEFLLHNKARLRNAAFYLFNLVWSLILFVMVVYFQYFGGIVTYTSLLELNQVGAVGDSIRSLIRPQYFIVFADLLPLLLWHSLRSNIGILNLRLKRGLGILVILAFALVSWNTFSSAKIINEVRKAEGMSLLMYQLHVGYTDLKNSILSSDLVTMQEIRRVKQLDNPKNPQWFGSAKDRHVIVVQLESFQTFLIGLEIAGREVTPNLNRLLAESFYFDRFFQQIARGNTSDSEFAMNTSIYPSNKQSTSSLVAGLEVPSLPRLLRERGYTAVTMHTNEAQFWNRNEMYPALGFNEFYDKAYFGEEDYIAFGASDEVLYEKSMDILLELNEQNQRIYANVIAMSSHNPFDLPPEKNKLPLPTAFEETLLGRYLQACHYADHALGQFIADLQKHGLWDDSLFIVYGDHFGFPDSAPAEELLMAADLIQIPEYTKLDMFNVPLFIRMPGQSSGQVMHQVGSQVDIMPTLANLLGIDLEDLIVFGQDLFNHEHNLVAQRVYLPTGSFINDEVMFIPGKGFEDGRLIPFDRTQPVDNPERFREDYDRVLRLLELSDAHLEGLSTR